MPTKIIFIYDNPTDPDAFEAAYPEQFTLAERVPGVQQLESSKVWPKEDGSPTPAYRLLELSFSSYETASAAVTTEEAGKLIAYVFELATGGVRIVFVDVEKS